MLTSDLAVTPISDALAGVRLSFVVSGSIAAVESVRTIRALRRLGADVWPVLTHGGAQFITAEALAWASANHVTTNFEGLASHLASHDACIVSPASAALIGKIAQGITDSPAAALVASYLGAKRQVIVFPAMHESLLHSPAVAKNLTWLSEHACVMTPRMEEGKAKAPEPAVAADEMAHKINQELQRLRAGKLANSSVLITLGTTRGYLDDVRYVSNYSSGRLGSLIAEELYRHGISTFVVAGPSPVKPTVATKLTHVETNDEMLSAAHKFFEGKASGPQAAVLSASVLDFIPSKREAGKMRSTAAEWNVRFVPTEKIISKISPTSGIKVGFKLESELDESSAQKWATDYMDRYGLSMFVANRLQDVDQNRHRAFVFEQKAASHIVDSKENLAQTIAQHVIKSFKNL